MAIPSFFRQTKPRGFNYVPRYYDPQKEEWDRKRAAISTEHPPTPPVSGFGGQSNAQSAEWKEGSIENKPYRSKIMRGSMKNYFPRYRERVQKQSMIRFIVILIILAFVIYIYLRY
jgi:hypothetical protein